MHLTGTLSWSSEKQSDSQQNFSWFEVWKPKCEEATSKRAVRRLYRQTGKVLVPETTAAGSENIGGEQVSDSSLAGSLPSQGGQITETFFNRGTEVCWAGTLYMQLPSQQGGRIVGAVCSHSMHLAEWWKGCKAVVYQYQPGAEWRLRAAQCSEGSGLETGHVIIAAQTEAPSLEGPPTGEGLLGEGISFPPSSHSITFRLIVTSFPLSYLIIFQMSLHFH